MLELKIKSSFSAAHHLNGYEGNCRETHGHTFGVLVVVRVNHLDDIGIGKDFKLLKKDVDFILDQFDHKYLNNLPAFSNQNPTSENIAIWLFESLREKINGEAIRVYSVTVEESEKYSATYYGD